MAEFAIDRFVDLAGAVQLDDLDWDEVKRVGVTDVEARLLRYMADTETHTILYLRDLLAGHTAHDPEITAFLSVWVFEELWHGRAIDRVLAAAGRPPPPDQYTKVTKGASLRELVEAVLSHAAAYSTPRFIATHMTWGAINELTAGAAYKELERRTANRPLATLLGRMAKQERKHFSFYFHQAEKRLQGDRKAQALARFALKNFWTIVGSGVGKEDNLEFVAAHLFGGEDGWKAIQELERQIHELPGMKWFDRASTATRELAARWEAKNGPARWGAAPAVPAPPSTPAADEPQPRRKGRRSPGQPATA